LISESYILQYKLELSLKVFHTPTNVLDKAGTRGKMGSAHCPIGLNILVKFEENPFNNKEFIEHTRLPAQSRPPASYFWSYCPLIIFILELCVKHNSKSIQATDLKFHRQIDLIRGSAVHKKQHSRHTFGVIALCSFSILEFCPENFLK